MNTMKRIGDICEVVNGFAFKSNEYVENGIRVMRITNVQKGKIVDDDPKFFPIERQSEISRYLLKEKDLLISLTGNVGRIGLLTKEMLPAALNQRVACLRAKTTEIFINYLFYILNSNRFESYCTFNAAGIAQKNMSTKWLKDYGVPIPPLPEQERIVAELDLLTEIIDKQKAQLKELDNLAQSIFYDMFGDPVENEKGWNIKRLGDVCKLVNGFAFRSETFKPTGLPILRISNIQDDNILEKDMVYFSPKDYNENLDKYKVDNGDIVIAMSGATTGKLGVHKGCCTYYLNQRVGKFSIIDNAMLNTEYLFYYLKTISSQILTDAMGVAQPNISSKQIHSYKLPKPPIFLQHSFASKIENIEKQKEAITRSIAEMQLLFDYTMDKYFA